MKRLTVEWVRKAEADFQAARKVARGKPRLNDQVGFLCQQTVEKYLKALLHELGQPVPQTHDLRQLLNLLLPHDSTLGSLRRGVEPLTKYGVAYRYPGKHATTRQAQSALRQAQRVRQEIRRRLGIRARRSP